jgi:integrase
VPTSEETARFLAAAKERATDQIGRRDRVLFTLLLRLGIRLGAALALDVADVDFATNCAISHGKHSTIQKVYFPKDVAVLIKSHLKENRISSAQSFVDAVHTESRRDSPRLQILRGWTRARIPRHQPPEDRTLRPGWSLK